jgi:hypothetical protein
MAQAKDDAAQASPVDEAPEEIVVEEDDDEIVVEEAPTTESATATATLTDEKAESPLAGERVVYVTTPTPPKPRSNRVVGSILALAGAVLFGAAFAGVGALLVQVTGAPGGFASFIRDAAFWVPVLFFTVAFVLMTLLLNRATWWLHVIASILVAAVVYFGTVGVLVLLGVAGFTSLLLEPFVIAAAVIAREVSIWVGLLISRRGIRLTASNRAEREAFDAEQKASDGATATSA